MVGAAAAAAAADVMVNKLRRADGWCVKIENWKSFQIFHPSHRDFTSHNKPSHAIVTLDQGRYHKMTTAHTPRHGMEDKERMIKT